MNDNVHRLPTRTEFKYRSQLHDDLRRIIANAYDHGFKIGEAVGKASAAKMAQGAVNSALGVGVLIGTGIGVIVAVVVGGSL